MKRSLLLPFYRPFLTVAALFVTPLAAIAQSASFEPTVSTFAGTGAFSFVNGAADKATFNVVSAIKQDSKGNFFVVDGKNNCIRKITPAGIVSTFAGNGAAGAANGTGIAARFNNPYDMVIDASDNLYVTDLNNRTIRKITPAAVVSLYAGIPGSADYIDGPKGFAKLYTPRNITIDTAGNLYVIDSKLSGTELSTYIRKITPSGAISTFVGGTDGDVNGIGKAARFRNPEGLFADNRGLLFVADAGNYKIKQIRLSDTLVSTFAGSVKGTEDGTLQTGQFRLPVAITGDNNGHFYVSDYESHTIRMITGNEITTLAGNTTQGFVNGAAAESQFYYPISLVAGTKGDVYVCDVGNNVIREISRAGLEIFRALAGTPSAEQAFYVRAQQTAGAALKVEAPAEFELSQSQSGPYTPFLLLPATSGVVPLTKLYVRLSGANAVGLYSGTISLIIVGTNPDEIPVMSVTGTVSTPLGIEKETNKRIGLFPNPATELLEIRNPSEVTSYQVTDPQGKIRMSAIFQEATNTFSLNIAALPSGTYVLQLTGGEKQSYALFVKK